MNSSRRDAITLFEFLKGTFLIACLGTAFICLVAVFAPSPEEMMARKAAEAFDRTMTSTIANCVAMEGPWKCFVKLEEADASDPVEGATRIQRLARMVPAWEVLAFCVEPRKVDCADRMVGKGYSREDILAALGE